MKTRTRRWSSFSLRTLLTVFTVIALWMGVRAERAHRVRQLMSAIRADGGMPHFDYESFGPPGELIDASALFTPRTPPGPDWLRNLIGVEFFAYVEGIAYWEATGDSIRVYRPSDGVREINVLGGSVTDEGLRLLSRLQSLEGLHVQFSEGITDDGLHHIGKLKRLAVLGFNFSPNITDAGLPHLYGLSRLRVLDLYGTQCTEQGIADLQNALPLCEVNYKDDS